MPPVPADVLAWFTQAQEVGLLGPASIDEHVEHTTRFLDALGSSFAGRALDLGTGAGVPGLVLAAWWPATSWLLVDGKQKRAALLGRAVRGLGWEDRVEVRCGRAEAMAHEPAWREQFDLVVARAFGPPAVVAECAAGFLAVGGRLAVSEPPDESTDRSRWEGAPVGELGLRVDEQVASVQLLVKEQPIARKYPRRIGMPAKRPLF